MVATRTKMSCRRPKRSVTFAPTARMICVTHLHDMTNDEVESIWYDGSDYDSFHRDCQMTMCLARAAATAGRKLARSNTTLFCEIGLEHVISKTQGALRRKRRQLAYDVVLREQHCQKLADGSYMPEAIADLYEVISSRCHEDAHKRALKVASIVCHDLRRELETIKMLNDDPAADDGANNVVAQIYSGMKRQEEVHGSPESVRDSTSSARTKLSQRKGMLPLLLSPSA